jgi:transcription initiation factor TFIID subunit 2
MDFGTMSQNVAQGAYSTMEDFAKDVELVFSNCRTFNPPLTYPVTCADVVEKAFKKDWAKATEKKLSWPEKRALQGVMTTIVREDMYVLLPFSRFGSWS